MDWILLLVTLLVVGIVIGLFKVVKLAIKFIFCIILIFLVFSAIFDFFSVQDILDLKENFPTGLTSFIFEEGPFLSSGMASEIDATKEMTYNKSKT